MAASVILHHYPTSPFSEKVRLVLGLKGLDWAAVVQPVIMPKPELTALTGGYRRIPVMQIGADVFCDSAVIIDEIERRFPDPPVARPGDFAVAAFADRMLFQPTVALVFGALGAAVDPAFAKDREALSGRQFDAAAMKAAGPFALAQYRAALAAIEDGLAGGDFLGGAAACLADISLYMDVWFYAAFAPEPFGAAVKGFAQVQAWRARVAAIGHGRSSEMSREAALDIARDARPVVSGEVDDPLGLEAGDAVSVAADDYGRDPIRGRLAALDARRVTLLREDSRVGEVSVTFPRAGFVVTAG
ncbi:MAG TPA: glutathione S-transferase family protein [Caulobacteraceae bacterium]|jgi:glutathione S-transferase|nr:glutathione S-transferase family protein [Caulobacteraceae bacterium]